MQEKVPRAVIERVLERYNLGKLKRYHYFRHGLTHTSATIHTTKGRFVFRAYSDQNRKEYLYQANLAEYVRKRGFPTARVIPGKNGELVVRVGRQLFSIFSLVEGSHWHKQTPVVFRQVGETLGQLDNLLLDYKPSKKFTSLTLEKWGLILRALKHEAPQAYKTLAPAYEELMTRLPAMLPGCRKSLIHADFTPSNVLGKGSKLTGVIDFGDVHKDYLVYDLAVAVAQFCLAFRGKGGSLYIRGIKPLISGYESRTRLNEAERRALYYFILLRILSVGLWAGEGQSEKVKSYFMKWTINGTKTWKKLSPEKFEKTIWG